MLSLEKIDPEALKGLDEAIKAKGDFNDAFKKQEWSKNQVEIDKCMATPTNQQPTQMVGVDLWLQWCKEKQTERGMNPDPYTDYVPKDTRSDFEKSEYGQCSSTVTHLQRMAGGLEQCKGLPGDPERNDDTRTHNATPINTKENSAIACCQGLHDRLGIHTKQVCNYPHVQQEHRGCLWTKIWRGMSSRWDG